MNDVGIAVFMELHRRLLGGKFGEIPKPLSDDAFAQRSYCIDAPEIMPAGSHVADEIAGEGFPMWSMIERIPAGKERT